MATHGALVEEDVGAPVPGAFVLTATPNGGARDGRYYIE